MQHRVSAVLVRLSSFFRRENFVVVFVTLMRWMMIMTINIRIFNILPLAIRNCKLKKFVFEHKVTHFFEKTRNMNVSEQKTNQTRRKYSSRRSFWYHPQHQTPNSEEERSIQRCVFDSDVCQGGICINYTHYKGNVKEHYYISPWQTSESMTHL